MSTIRGCTLRTTAASRRSSRSSYKMQRSDARLSWKVAPRIAAAALPLSDRPRLLRARRHAAAVATGKVQIVDGKAGVAEEQRKG